MSGSMALDLEVVEKVLDFSVFRVMTHHEAEVWFEKHYGMGFFHYSENMADAWRDIVGRLTEVGFSVQLFQTVHYSQAVLYPPQKDVQSITAYGKSAPEAISRAALELVNRYPDILKIKSLAH